MVVHYLVNRSGIAVLVYVNDMEPALYSLSMKTSDTQAAISLQCSLHVRGFDDGEQTFNVEYGPDNLVSGTTIIDTAGSEHKLPSQGRLARISRTASSANLKFLRLKIGNFCPIWCPRSSGSIAPKHDSDAAFAHLRQLARSTVVHVLFDYNWVHVDKRKMLQDLFDEQKRKIFSTLPLIPSYELQHRKADWTVFSPDEPLAAAPPPYPGKRPRSPNTSSPLPEALSQKRVFLSLDPAGSPTEVATTASSPTPASPRLLTDNPSAPENIEDIVKDIVNDAVKVATDSRLEAFHDEIIQYVEDRCKEADVEFQETLDDHRLDIITIKEDELADFARSVDRARIEYQDTIIAFKEEAELDTGHDTARYQGRHFEERKLLDEEGQLLDNESRLLDEEQQHLEYERRHLENKRRHLAQRRLLLDRRRQLLEREQSASTSTQ